MFKVTVAKIYTSTANDVLTEVFSQRFDEFDLKAFIQAINSLPAPRKRRKSKVATLAET